MNQRLLEVAYTIIQGAAIVMWDRITLPKHVTLLQLELKMIKQEV